MKEMICRLCLQTIGNNNCQPVEESLLKSLKLNLKISKENVMCIECATCLRAFSNITPGCASDLKNGVKCQLKIKCIFCRKVHRREDLISLQVSGKNKFLLEQYISDKNLKNTEELLTCETCLASLEGVLSVILRCLEVEEKIRKYIELQGTDDKGQVELKKVQQFMFSPIADSEIESFGVNELEDGSDQVQEEYTTMAEAEIKYEKEISNTELIIKTEAGDITSEESDCNIPDIKSEQSDCDGFQEPVIKDRSPPKLKTFKCGSCSYAAKRKLNLKRHLLTHKSPSELKMFKCEMCSYETKHKYYLKYHLLTHRNPSEIKMFECEFCSYQTKRKSNLTVHLLTHKSLSDAEMFKCEFCLYQTKYKTALTNHLSTHKSPSEMKMYKCEFCSHQTQQKKYLAIHLLTHKSPSEIKMFKCEMCSYKARQKVNLQTHLLTHKAPSQVTMFKCASCSYETKQSCHLKRHLLTHKSRLEVKMFKCESCAYETKHKSALKRHLFTHKSPSEKKMFHTRQNAKIT